MRVLLCLLAVTIVHASDVIDFHENDWDDGIKDHEVALVEFYAPWCGHCKKLAPEYERAASKLVKNDPPVALAKVDCTSDKSVCDKFGVSGFPTLKVFRNGEFSADYQGPREADGIVKYMRGQVGASSKELKSLADIHKFLDSEEHSVVGFFETDSKLMDGYTKVADTDRERYRFAHTSNKEIIDKYEYKDDIVVFQPKNLNNKFENNQIKYDGNYDTDKIKKFLETELQGLCGVRTQDNNWQFAKPLVVAYFAIDYVKNPKGTNYWRNRVLKVAQDYKRKVNFAISDKFDFGAEMEEHGIAGKDGDKPTVAAMGAKGEKFAMEAEFSVENLSKFVEDFEAGKLDAFMKSEPVPDNQGQGVKTVVAKNFNEVVSDDKDVLIEFYAPWCGHCKKLVPVWDALGEELKDEDSVVIAKMDATANDVPPAYSVRGFPTIFWKPAGGEPTTYQGGRELDDLLKYVAKTSTKGLKAFDKKGKKTEL